MRVIIYFGSIKRVCVGVLHHLVKPFQLLCFFRIGPMEDKLKQRKPTVRAKRTRSEKRTLPDEVGLNKFSYLYLYFKTVD